MKKKTLHDFNKMKKEGTPASWVTAYDYPLAKAAENAEIDMILVGDSGGMCQLGYENTHPVTMDEMITMAKAVKRGAPNTFLIGDMPQGSYEISKEDAVKNALRFIKEAGCDAIKLEGGERVRDKVKAIVNSGIVVFGHLGLTPQSTESFGGYRVQGKTIENFNQIVEDSIHLVNAGISVLLLEAMPSEPAGQISKLLDIPVYGVGAGKLVDGQLLIIHDLLGLYPNFRPYFAKCYIRDTIEEFKEHFEKVPLVEPWKEYGRKTRMDGFSYLAMSAIIKYIYEVKHKIFPSDEYCYPIKEEELNELKKSMYWEKLKEYK